MTNPACLYEYLLIQNVLTNEAHEESICDIFYPEILVSLTLTCILAVELVYNRPSNTWHS